jgi:putative membrane protein
MFSRRARALVLFGACGLWVACKGKENAADTTSHVDTAAGAVVPAPAPTATAPALTDPNIAGLLDEANAADSSAGKLASTKGTSADVKAFGRQMMRDHHMLRKQGQDLAKKLSLTPQPPAGDSLPAMAQKSMDNLTSMPKGPAWDKAYIDNEVGAHQAVLKLLGDAGNAAQNQELKDLIAKATPAIQGHLDKAQSIQSKLNNAPAAPAPAATPAKKP